MSSLREPTRRGADADSRRPALRAASGLLGLAFSAFFTWIAVRHVDFRIFRHELEQADYRWIAPSLVTLVAAVYLRVVRWRMLFAARTRPALGPLTEA
jgi:uncharacterized membrane protein YbhN (UPF0104 family)